MTLARSLSHDGTKVRSGEGEINHRISPPLELGLPYWFHLFFPDRALTTNLSILVVGCDDDLAVQLARANPRARIIALEQRPAARAAAEQAAQQQCLANLELVSAWPPEPAAEDGFDLIYYNQSSWPGESPQAVLSTAARLLRLEGSLHLTLRSNYAWSGVRIVRELLEKLAVHPDAEGYTRAREIAAALGPNHPWNLLGLGPQMRSDDLLSDWLRVDDPCFSVPKVYELLAASGLVLQRFTHQPYYLPQCSPLARTPMLAEVRRLPLKQQHALMELYWPGIRQHLAVACRADRPPETFQIDFGGGDWLFYAPLLPANLPVDDDPAPLGAKARLSWRAAGMPEMAVSLGGFQHRLLQALDRAEELGEVVGLAGLSGDPQLRDEWARDFFQMMSDYDFLHFRICHSPRQPPIEAATEALALREPGQVWAELSELSELQLEARPQHGSSATLEACANDALAPADEEIDSNAPAPAASEAELAAATAAPRPSEEELAASEAELWALDDEPAPKAELAVYDAEPSASEVELTSVERELAEAEPTVLEAEPTVSEVEPAALRSGPQLTASEPDLPPPADDLVGAQNIPTCPSAPALDAAGEQHASEADSHDTNALTAAAPTKALAEPQRVLYEACPLCAEGGYESLHQVETEIILQGEPLRITIPWVRCGRCAHVFAQGYFAGEAWTRILGHTLRWRRTLRVALVRRPEASRIVAAITTLRESAKGRWLDVGCSESGLVAAASEFGYDAAGVDCCSEAAELLAALGYAVVGGSLFDCKDGPFDVVSLSGVVDAMPFPAQALTHVQRLLAPRGLLYVSARTSDSLRWRKLEGENANPYWGRLDRYHVFRRKSLFRLLQNCGFEPCSYGASGTDGVSMEVIACKR